ncbi:TraB/GumN family protein [Chryseolinea soli]|uniref:TraB/GumN family protein n=1 Tax=Chryseolinea soli TaxID=2321403 RepID=A0A385SJD9_9BACT|nr:TraB/GumN family protein [Chryseolinea soli]AYB29500.1 TraB/GumN family protein [Chryseolinea soli]
MRSCARLFFWLTLCGLSPQALAQSPAAENAVFWEISANGLSKPSYLFGTFHLKGSTYVDSLTQVIDKFKGSGTVVGELLFDSTMTMKVMTASIMKDTTLDMLMSREHFQQTASWLKELTGYDLKMFNKMNPMMIEILIMSTLQQKYFPAPPNDRPMDLYFQQRAKTEGKKMIGLESFDEQINALYNQFSYKRQADMLMDYVLEKDRAKSDVVNMNRYYREGNLSQLESMMTREVFSEKETDVLVNDRNRKWMIQLPGLMKEQQTFIAVGALHLAGENGLVALLRKAGYVVRPVRML